MFMTSHSGTLLESVLFRVGILAALRSKKLDGKTIGVMITASHNPEQVSTKNFAYNYKLQAYTSQDNGVKLVDPRGEMLEAAWERYATELANAPTTADLLDTVDSLITTLKIDLSKPANIVYARDTRPSGPTLVAAFEDGLRAMGASGRNEGVTTTPILHYLVRCINSKGTKEEYGEDSEDGYLKKLSDAFKKLVVRVATIQA